jgi:ActR/RegA family two-component response regulator
MLSVLLIDNDEDQFFLFYRAFHRLAKSPNCVHATSAESGLQMLQVFNPNYVYVDFHLSGTSGLECVRQIRKLKRFLKKPIVVYSDMISGSQWDEARAAGATSFLNKANTDAALAENILFFY